jgi:transcriptional regulator
VRHAPAFATEDTEVVKELIRANPWGVLISAGEPGPVASHYPIMLDEDAPGLTVLTHVGKPDDELHAFGPKEMLLIVQGPHGYVSPSWYAEGDPRIPTWNFSVAHCYAVPEILSESENLRTLTRLTAHFERHVERPAWLDPELGARVSTRTVGLRLPITRFVCKLKMSQNRSPETRSRVLDELRGDGPYANPVLADDMERILKTRAPL